VNWKQDTVEAYRNVRNVNLTKRLTCPKCGADNHFGNLKCKDCAVEL